MSKVIKDNNGVAIVEGTPAASLIKDAGKFFAAKVDTRMAGEVAKPQTMKSIVQSGKIDTRPVQEQQSQEAAAASALTKPITQMIDGKNTVTGYMMDGKTTMFDESQMNLSSLERADLLPQRVKTAMQGGDPGVRVKSLSPIAINTKPPSIRPEDVEIPTRPKSPTDPDAILAMNLARDFKRRRSSKEAERSQEERDATKGRFITTLGR